MKPNILFLVIDSLRSDKCFGPNKNSKTPNIDRLINGGIYFKNAISSSNSSSAAWLSWFTGLYPFNTKKNKAYQKIAESTHSYIKDLKKYEYHVFSTMPRPAEHLGFTKDFENKDSSFSIHSRLHKGLGDSILEKINENLLQEPWFYFIHILDLHSPIYPPKEFDNNEFGKNPYERTISAIDSWIGKILKQIDLKKTIIVITADHGNFIPINTNEYDLEISRSNMDKKLWQLEDKIPKSFRSIVRKTARMIEKRRQFNRQLKIKNLDMKPFEKRNLLYSDLFTMFNPSSEYNFLFDDIVKVPLIITGNGIKEHKIIDTQIRNSLDIFPTIFEMVGINLSEKIDGESLIPIIEGKDVKENLVYMEGHTNTIDTTKNVIGVRTSKYKYFRIRDESAKNVHLYDLESDPLEENNIVKTSSEIAEKMEGMLIQIQKNSKETIEFEEMSDEEAKNVEDELKKLGYL